MTKQKHCNTCFYINKIQNRCRQNYNLDLSQNCHHHTPNTYSDTNMKYNSILLEDITGYDKHYNIIHNAFDEMIYPLIHELCELKNDDESVYIKTKHKEHQFEYKIGLMNMETEHKRKRRRIIIKMIRDEENYKTKYQLTLSNDETTKHMKKPTR